ncbi:TadE/TadG family type IV pilus assembly protein [Parasphingorhabdus cellanae]|uniref:Pilus assembly protein n=1 Tax=Parasphingorhabdus cellanae TaxID=2806553 RepID=A0ABX7T3N9_9SPHN|nr:TadE/TadG family type IV pilus assembly protein [Parasphingorhabdus cellanae]QTD56183.1 pilus assembly protein [Parasphingorhabdus cellanae]
MVTKNEIKSQKSFLQKLRSDAAGNTLAMAAAALFPIMGLVGGGVDMGRAYMAKARLQQACDAGVLAGRRNMTQDTMTAADIAEAQKFFDFNFPEESFGSTKFDATVMDKDGTVASVNKLVFQDGADARVVEGQAQTTIKTTLMRVFGYENMVIKTDCSSRLDVGNVDVMMVLDVTGSMGNSVSDGGSRLDALKVAVEDFYGILGPGGGATGEQIRYGFVPYSSTVNVGEILYDANPDWLIGGNVNERATYQTRQAVFEVEDKTAPGYSLVENDFVESLNQLDGPECTDRYAENLNVDTYFVPNPDGNPVAISETRAGNIKTVVTDRFSYLSWNGSTDAPPAGATGSANWRVCERTRTRSTEEIPIVQVDKWEPGALRISDWVYNELTHDVYDYVRSIKSGNPAAQNPSEGAEALERWDGCIVERQSDNSITTATTTIPSDAYDLQIDLLPTNAVTKWSPFWRNLKYDRSSNPATSGSKIALSGDSAACPAPARKLQSYTTYDDGSTNDLQSYIDGLQDGGFTNHTIGMIWGARLLSADGLFKTENESAPNGFSIGRHVVFMTDGSMVIRQTNYGAYGFQKLDDSIAAANSGDGTLEDLQAHRFQLMCAATRAKGWTIWVVQFGVTNVTPNMLACASSPGNASAATDKASLQAAFANIAQKIGGLRLSN